MGKRALERRLSEVADFADPRVEWEQYPTPADLAAHLVHLADVHGDVARKTVVDLGTGTGVLALGAATRDPERVVALDRDPAALRRARENERRVAPAVPVEWLLADATRAPLCAANRATDGVTVVMNPPFGAQKGNEHADRAFLETTAGVADVSYSIHNEGSENFVEAFAADAGGDVTHAFRAELALSRRFDFQRRERTTLDAEVFRIEWR
ncbi:METTL5 family protein [Haladaptatus salinisoli]|uniref:METTL5 family protein n=1 Tax=Haladaptatus salinisoli TaxID=2884876 RepID=UPI001D0A8466|nr:METTL5 family protein [Haladaptatus salinisoli]